MKGDAERGKQVFTKTCAACHKVQTTGNDIGPNLAAMKARGPEAILLNVLDPNREVNPQYLNYAVMTTDGRQLTGLIAAETATSITLKRADNATDTVLRIDIEQLKHPFVSDKATPSECSAGVENALSQGWLELHGWGKFVRFTQAGEDLLGAATRYPADTNSCPRAPPPY